MLGRISLDFWLFIASATIGMAGAAVYIRDTFAGRTNPNLVTWSMWSLAPLVGAAAAFASGADHWATARIFLAGFFPLLIFTAALINPNRHWKLSPFDLACGACSFLALVVWGVVDSPRLAILLAATGDGFATFPTLRKAWRYPETETGVTYITIFVSIALVTPFIPEWNIENSAFQIYLLAANALLIFAVYRGRFGVRTEKRLAHCSE